MNIKKEIILSSVLDDFKLNDTNLIERDWKNILDFLLEKRLLLFIYPKIRKYVTEELIDYYDKEYENQRNYVDRQINEMKLIQKNFNEHGIDVMFVKGVTLSRLAYNTLYARKSSDIDILVQKGDMIRAYTRVNQLGYQFLEGYDKNNLPNVSESPDYLFSEDYHEFPCLKNDQSGNQIEIEIKYATSAIPYKYISDFQQNYQFMDLDGVLIKTFSTPFMLIHICAHLYVNTQGEDGYLNNVMFRDFVDLKMFLCHNGKVDWKFICKKAKEYKIVHQLYFSLCSVNKLWSDTVNEEIIKLFDPCEITYEYAGNEFGELYTWKTDIITRCFDEELRLKEFSHLFKTELFHEKDISYIEDDGHIHPFLMKKDNIEIHLFMSYQSLERCIRLITLFDMELFQNENLYFFITVYDNNVDENLIERNISNSNEVCYTNLKGTWETFGQLKQGVNFIDISVEGIFTKKCDKVCVLVDIYKKIGKCGFRGTGTKGKYIVHNVIKK